MQILFSVYVVGVHTGAGVTGVTDGVTGVTAGVTGVTAGVTDTGGQSHVSEQSEATVIVTDVDTPLQILFSV